MNRTFISSTSWVASSCRRSRCRVSATLFGTAAMAACLASPPTAWGAAYTWLSTATGTQTYENSANWDPNTGYPNAASDVAKFTTNPSAATYVETALSTLTVGSMDFRNASNISRLSGVGDTAAGTLVFDNGGSNATLYSTNNLTLKFTTYQLNSTLTIDQNGGNIFTPVVMQGNFTGSGGLTVIGAAGERDPWAGFQLSGSNNYAGGTSLNNSTLTLYGSIVGGVSMSNNSMFRIGNTGSPRTQSLMMTGAITGTGAVVTPEAGVTFDNDANSWNGPLMTSGNFPSPIIFTSIKNVGGGPSALGAPQDATAGRIIMSGGTPSLEYIGSGDTTDRVISLEGIFGEGFWNAAVRASGSTTTASPFKITSNLAGGYVPTFKLGGTGAGEWSGVIGTTIGETGVVKEDAGTWTLSGANTYTTKTRIDAGRLRVGSNTALGTGTLTFNGGALSVSSTASRTLANNPVEVNADATIGDAVDNGLLTLTGSVSLGGATRSITTPSDVTISGTVSNGGITKLGAGKLTLSSANTYAGNTTISAGRLTAGNANALGTAGTITINNGGTLGVADGVTFTRPLTINAGGKVWTGNNSTVALPNAASLAAWMSDNTAGGDFTSAAILSATGTTTPSALTSAWTSNTGSSSGYLSDILSLAGTGTGNVFVLSMSYSTVFGDMNIWYRETSGDAFAPVGTSFVGLGAWNSSYSTVGQYGRDPLAGTVWVVTDHNSEFVIVPEPGTLALAGIAAAFAGWAGRRRRLANASARRRS